MDIYAVRGSFGDFGRVTKGQILKDVAKGQAEKMIASGAFRAATSDDHENASKRKTLNSLSQKQASGGSIVEGLKAEIEKLKKAADEKIAKVEKAAQDKIDAATKDAAEAKAALEETEKRHAAEIAALKTSAEAEIAKVKADAEASAKGGKS